LNNSKIIVGITGGIGSGKTFVCKILNAMGYPVFYSDIVAKDLIAFNQEVKQQVINVFGKKTYFKSGELNKNYLAQQIFSDKNKLEQINQIVHPAVKKKFKEWVSEQSSDLIFYESAILFETDSYKDFDKVILVVASKETKIKRILNRDNTSLQEIEKRMINQWSDNQKIPLADYIITNNDDSMLMAQINKIIKDLKAEN
jgi:dephospho-CoA kinase